MSASDAAISATEASGAAASLDLPTATGQAGRYLRQKPDETGLEYAEVEVNVFRVTGRARVLDIGNKAFPSDIYTIRKYPGLRR